MSRFTSSGASQSWRPAAYRYQSAPHARFERPAGEPSLTKVTLFAIALFVILALGCAAVRY